ncbi:unnamed protein product [Euphydryas editha]|uniref:Tyrosine-protein phosphatase domain-containing protein n=1 Tax=Euphydryas editha TaxID=104508 RepID=A0AAU9UMW2_EUPED|nr:unnamed protein product [Euphydryas editha]
MGANFTKKNSFAENCEQLIKESNLGHILEQEHHRIVEESVPYSCYEVLKFDNWSKCRYWNTSIFDRNRVILPTEDGGSDFINASHVDGDNVKGRFLCTQAPLQETATDFWQMIFSHQVRFAIRTWSRGEIQDDAGDISGMSQPSISLICRQVALAIVPHIAQWIKMPQNDIDQKNVIAAFYAICGFRQVIGAIDCTHIKIPKVGGNIGQYYINRKGYSSSNIQVMSNANLEIMDLVAHWRGSTHDSRIYNECHLKQRFEQGEFKGRLLADSAYAYTPYMYTPVLIPRSQKEESYNSAHIRTRNTVERCFGVWKQRFRCLLRGFTTKLDNTKLYIVALAILQNIAMQS